MDENIIQSLLATLDEYHRLGIAEQIDYQKFYLYSIITHSTAIEGSTVTEIENQLLFDEGIAAKGRTMVEQLMNLDLKAAYEEAMRMAPKRIPFSTEMLQGLSALVMKNTGSQYSTLSGTFDSSKGELRKVNVTAGIGGRSYLNFLKVPARLADFCRNMNERQELLKDNNDIIAQYALSFDAHNLLVAIHPWVDGNGRMSRLVMNYIQMEYGLVPTKVLKDDRAEYIQALVDSREQDSLEPFRDFMFRSHLRNLQQEIAAYKQSMEDNVTIPEVEPQHVVKDVVKDVVKEILDILRARPESTAASIANQVQLSSRQVQRILARLQKEGSIMRHGGRKEGYWEVQTDKNK